MTNNNIHISIKEYLGEDRFIDYPLIIFCKTPIVNSGEDFFWEGEYNGRTITVILHSGDTEYFAEINGTEGLNIDDKIRSEIKGIIRQLN